MRKCPRAKKIGPSFQPGPPWVYELNGDPILWINFYRDGAKEYEPEDWANLAKALGAEPAVSLMADVTGRHFGDEQVRTFVCTLLGQFQGLAQDDYTNYYWTRLEVLSGFLVRGHPFFDCQGWFKEESWFSELPPEGDRAK